LEISRLSEERTTNIYMNSGDGDDDDLNDGHEYDGYSD
jgi:hypothetical protein